jgi:hypothetical protein
MRADHALPGTSFAQRAPASTANGLELQGTGQATAPV